MLSIILVPRPRPRGSLAPRPVLVFDHTGKHANYKTWYRQAPWGPQITNIAHLALHIPVSKLSLAVAKPFIFYLPAAWGSLWLPTSEDPLLRPMASHQPCCIAPALCVPCATLGPNLYPCVGAEQVPCLNICRYSSGGAGGAQPPPPPICKYLACVCQIFETVLARF